MDEREYKIVWLNTLRDSLLKMKESQSRDDAIALIDEMIAEIEIRKENRL